MNTKKTESSKATEKSEQPADADFVDETGAPTPWAPQMVDELARLSPPEFMHKLGEALRWYVVNDDTNLGQDSNEFWELGYYKGKALIEAYDQRLKATPR
jgi:hypothetical protein